jgi:two-component system phosphate regulon response regulator OmpR
MSEKYHILVIDDDTRLRNLLGKFLQDNGFITTLAKDTSEARLLINMQKFDLLIVDVMLPNENGIDFTATIRQSHDFPVIMLTARHESEDRIKGFESGADDYIPKPFEPKELLLRINNILRRINHKNMQFNQVAQEITFGDFSFNLNDLRLKKLQEFVHITDAEAKILKILGDNFGTAISRHQLSEILGGIDDRSIDVTITRLRKKIESNPKQPHYLQTVRNFGYILNR